MYLNISIDQKWKPLNNQFLIRSDHLNSAQTIVFTIIFILGKKIPIIILIPIMFTSSEYIISIFFYGFPWFTFSLLLSSNEYLLFSLKLFGTLFSSYLIIQIFCIPFIFLTKEKFKQEVKYLSLFIILPIITLMITNFNIEKNNFPIKF